MLATLKCLTIPALVLVLAGPVQAGTKYFTNYRETELTFTLIPKDKDKEGFSVTVKPGETRVLEYPGDLAESIAVKYGAGQGLSLMTDKDKINVNTQFFFTRKGVKMSPLGPMERMKIRQERKKKTARAEEKEKADRDADEKTMKALDQEVQMP